MKRYLLSVVLTICSIVLLAQSEVKELDSTKCKALVAPYFIKCGKTTTNSSGYCDEHGEYSKEKQKIHTANATNNTRCKGYSVSTQGRCTFLTNNKSGYCDAHKEQDPNYTNTSQKSSNKSHVDSKKVYDGRCNAITKKGTRCKRSANYGTKFCWQHQ